MLFFFLEFVHPRFFYSNHTILRVLSRTPSVSEFMLRNLFYKIWETYLHVRPVVISFLNRIVSNSGAPFLSPSLVFLPSPLFYYVYWNVVDLCFLLLFLFCFLLLFHVTVDPDRVQYVFYFKVLNTVWETWYSQKVWSQTDLALNFLPPASSLTFG